MPIFAVPHRLRVFVQLPFRNQRKRDSQSGVGCFYSWCWQQHCSPGARAAARACMEQKMASASLPCGAVLSVPEGMFTCNVAAFLIKGSDSELPKRYVFDHSTRLAEIDQYPVR